MANEDSGTPNSIDVLNPDEVALLRKMQRRLEVELFYAVLRRLKGVIIVTGAVVTLFGIASLATLRSAVVDASSEKLSTTGAVREQVVANALAKLENVNAVVQRSDELNAKLDTEEAKALTVIRSDLDNAVRMLKQVEDDMAKPPRAPHAAP